MTSGPERVILAVHVRGIDGMCAGCRVWWSRLAPWPCWQVEWATSRLARASVARFLCGDGQPRWQDEDADFLLDLESRWEVVRFGAQSPRS